MPQAKTDGDRVLVSMISYSGLTMTLRSGVSIANLSDYYHYNSSDPQAHSDREPEPVVAHP